MSRLLACLPLACALLCGVGCQGGARTTTVARGATEQLLVSAAARRALVRYDASAWVGKRVFLAEGYYAALDPGYVTSVLREHLARSGATVVASREEAEVTLELRCASLGVTDGRFRVGVPALPIPLPGIDDGTSVAGMASGAVLSPEFSIGNDAKRGWAKVVVWACDPEGAHLGRQVLWGHAIDSTFYEDVYPSLLEELRGEGASQ
ncbi:MAG: hypothetical protein KDD82_21700 [Planctomycetes bacterium]|nr:hypothetical protein [Planctomycetota bacterium]